MVRYDQGTTQDATRNATSVTIDIDVSRVDNRLQSAMLARKTGLDSW